MPRRTSLWCLLLLTCSLPYHATAKIIDLPTLSVLVDSSINLPIAVISRNYARKNGIAVNVSSDASSSLVAKIVEGTEADIFITAHPRWVEDLKLQGMVDVYSPANLAINQLSLLTYAENPAVVLSDPKTLSRFLLETARNSTLMISNPDTREDGNYARKLLKELGIWEEIAPYLMYTENPFEIPAAVTSQNIYALTYRTATHRNRDVRILYDFSASVSPNIIYQGVVVAGEHMEEARQFLYFLEEHHSRSMLGSYGFKLPNRPQTTKE